MEERDLIPAVQRGDENAFEELMRRYENKVYSLCRRMCGNDADAEEAAQDTFLAVWRGIGAFRQESAFSTWLYRLASNACIDLLRRGRRSAQEPSLDEEELAASLRDDAPLPQEIAERHEMMHLIQQGMDALPAEYRSVLVLRELQQLSYSEIAECVGAELGTVKSRISRARLLLRNYLTAHGNFFEKPPSKTITAGKNASQDPTPEKEVAHNEIL